MTRWFKRSTPVALLLLFLLIVPASAQAPTCPPDCYAGPNGTTTDLTDPDAGSYSKQWRATSHAEMVPYLEAAGQRIAATGTPGAFYWTIDSSSYWKYILNAQGEPISGNRNPGQVPVPETGVDLPFSMVLIGLTLLGAILLASGYLLRPRLFRPAKP